MDGDTSTELEILPLTPRRLPDLARLFGEGGDPKRCWCSFFRLRNFDLRGASAQTNRAVLERAVETTAADGRAPGLIAYRDGEPVGWVSLGPRDDYDRLQASRVLAPIDGQPVWSIVCFVVSRRARKQGVAHALLDAAVAYAKEHGATLLEAYPAETHGQRIPSANAYKGTLDMFERHGFEVAARRRANRASPERPVVRRSLEPGRDRSIRPLPCRWESLPFPMRSEWQPQPPRESNRWPPDHVGGNAGSRRRQGRIEEAAGSCAVVTPSVFVGPTSRAEGSSRGATAEETADFRPDRRDVRVAGHILPGGVSCRGRLFEPG